jgi:hypothetical protein
MSHVVCWGTPVHDDIAREFCDCFYQALVEQTRNGSSSQRDTFFMKFLSQHCGAMLLTMERARVGGWRGQQGSIGFQFARVGEREDKGGV